MPIDITWGTVRGERDYQEDRYLIHQTEKGTLLGVADGHGGSDVAQACADYVGPFWDSCSRDTDDYLVVLTRVVREMDAITKEYQHQGSTLSLVFIPLATMEGTDKKIYVSILGDSPIITIKRELTGARASVSPIHNIRCNPFELDAAIDRGGCYTSNGYIARSPFGPGVQNSRSLGDGQFGPVVSKEPEVYEDELEEFLLVATDGVYDSSAAEPLFALASLVCLGAEASKIAEYSAEQTKDNATAILVRRTL